MWSYYGSKTNIVDLYPAPIHDKVIEPFAGTARYALKYFERDVLLVDKYDVIVKIWKWLQLCSPADILSLPTFTVGENINDFKYDCEEQRLLIGFMVCFGGANSRNIASPRVRDRPNHMPNRIKFIANNLFKIKHWEIRGGSYEEIQNMPATWFIDPPYQIGGHVYNHSNKKIDFEKLADWCIERLGQTIVCEGSEARWLPFVPLTVQNNLSGAYKEAIWTNYHTHYNNIQQKLEL